MGRPILHDRFSRSVVCVPRPTAELVRRSRSDASPRRRRRPVRHTGRMNQLQARTLGERREAAIDRLRSNRNLWLATARDGRGPHLIPVSYWWDGARLTTATSKQSRTLKNIKAQPTVRASIGSTGDVLMIDATAIVVSAADVGAEAAEGYARASRNPLPVPGFEYVQLVPDRMQVWNGPSEFRGRTVMLGGRWLDDPVD